MNDFMALMSYECSLTMKFLYNGETHIKTHQNNNKWCVLLQFYNTDSTKCEQNRQ